MRRLSQPSWPSRGAVSIRGLRAGYRPGLPDALKGLDVEIAGGEHIGVCGRTGSGKSTLASVLLRSLDVRAGAICVDGVDLEGIPRSRVRSAITLIPQHPFIFAGSLRKNLDPEGRHRDQEIIAALEQVDFLRVGGASGGGASSAGDGQKEQDHRGEGQHHYSLPLSVLDRMSDTLSTGQGQQLCIARALLRRSRVVIMDEGTASVDGETDRAIQAALRKSFASGRETTTITIAHRLDTILESDKILVMHDGRAVQFGPPAVLAADADGPFGKLIRAIDRTKAAPEE